MVQLMQSFNATPKALKVNGPTVIAAGKHAENGVPSPQIFRFNHCSYFFMDKLFTGGVCVVRSATTAV